jgi:hypothetical protein
VQVNIPVEPASISKFLSGNKTYIALAVGAVVIYANHAGLLPPEYAPAGLDPANWVNDEYKLILGAFARSALAKVGPSAGVAVQQAAAGQPVTGDPIMPQAARQAGGVADPQRPTG